MRAINMMASTLLLWTRCKLQQTMEKGENAQGSNTISLLATYSDPSSVVEFSDFLYKNDKLMESFSNALGPNGILIAQVGESYGNDEIPGSYDATDSRSTFVEGLGRVGFSSIVSYEEAHGRFATPWAFLLAMKNGDDRSRWYANEATWNSLIHRRILRTPDGDIPLSFFDSSAIMSYQFPTRFTERSWCLDRPGECNEHKPFFDPDVPDIPISSFRISSSLIPNSGRGVFANNNIPEGSFMSANECVQSMFVPSTTEELVKVMEAAHDHEFWKCLGTGYISGYGWTETFYVSSTLFASSDCVPLLKLMFFSFGDIIGCGRKRC
jgi:hypothetical protein